MLYIIYCEYIVLVSYFVYNNFDSVIRLLIKSLWFSAWYVVRAGARINTISIGR